MSKLLIIAEKPSVAKDIAVALGGFKAVNHEWWEREDAVVSSAIGHLAELHVPEAEARAPLPILPARFELRPVEGSGKARVAMLKSLMARDDVTGVINACDAGREGELIFHYLYTYNRCTKPVRRMWLQSMTADAIREAYQTAKPGAQYVGLRDAAQSRSEADWIVGINASRAAAALLRHVHGTGERVGVGRVQTPTLGLLVRREWAIAQFKSEDYWEVHATFGVAAGQYAGRWIPNMAQSGVGARAAPATDESVDANRDVPGTRNVHRIDDHAKAQAIVARCANVRPVVQSEETHPVKKLPPVLFDLTTLQREANQQFGLTAKETLDAAQSLYERHKALSYPRTDATTLPEDYVATAQSVLERLAGFDSIGELAAMAAQRIEAGPLAGDKRVFDNRKITDHFAIIPTGVEPAGVSVAEQQVFQLVTTRFVAAFYPPAEFLDTVRVTNVGDELFRSRGRVLVKAGWLAVTLPSQRNAGSARREAQTEVLCAVNGAEPITLIAVEAKTLQTRAPARFSEASLLAAMESAGRLVEDDDARAAMKDKGLGTPATRAPIIEGLIAKAYIERKAKQLVPTAKGVELVRALLEAGIEELTSAELTGEWEAKLAQMAQGQGARAQFMADIGRFTREIVSRVQVRMKALPADTANTAPCPDCGHAMTRRASKFKKGTFIWVCSGYPACKTVCADAHGKPAEKKVAPVASGEHKCPACQKPLVFRAGVGKKGPWKFWGCTGFPRCKETFEDVNGHPVEKADLK